MGCIKYFRCMAFGFILFFSAQVNAQNTDLPTTLAWVQEKFKLYGEFDDVTRLGNDVYKKYHFFYTSDGVINVTVEAVKPGELILDGDHKYTTISTVKLRNLDRYVDVIIRKKMRLRYYRLAQ